MWKGSKSGAEGCQLDGTSDLQNEVMLSCDEVSDKGSLPEDDPDSR